MKQLYIKTVILAIFTILFFGISKASINISDNNNFDFIKIEKQTKDPELFENKGKPMFKLDNNKLVLIDKDKFAETQALLDEFYGLQNQKLIITTQKYISDILKDDDLNEYTQNPLIQFFLYAACGKEINWWDLDISKLNKTRYIEIRKLGHNSVKLDANGNINSTENLLRKVEKQANAIPLNELKKNPTFSANFQDAQNLRGHKVELTKGGKELDEDGIVMVKMEEYYRFKNNTSTVNIKNIRNNLTAINRDISYRDPNKTTDEFIVDEYLKKMEEQEKLFQKKKIRREKTLKEWGMTIDDL